MSLGHALAKALFGQDEDDKKLFTTLRPICPEMAVSYSCFEAKIQAHQEQCQKAREEINRWLREEVHRLYPDRAGSEADFRLFEIGGTTYIAWERAE